jgi:replicative DNA helicase
MCIVDYIQQVKPNTKTKAGDKMFQVMYAAEELRGFASRHPITMICASQLKREAQGRRPVISDLEWSAEIEKSADCISFLYRNDDDGVVEFICAKDRAGAPVPTIIDLVYNTQTATLITKQEAEDKAAFGNQPQPKVFSLPQVKPMPYAMADGADLPF